MNEKTTKGENILFIFGNKCSNKIALAALSFKASSPNKQCINN